MLAHLDFTRVRLRGYILKLAALRHESELGLGLQKQCNLVIAVCIEQIGYLQVVDHLQATVDSLKIDLAGGPLLEFSAGVPLEGFVELGDYEHWLL